MATFDGLTFPAPDHAVRVRLRSIAPAWRVENVMRAVLGDERYDAPSAAVTSAEAHSMAVRVVQPY